MTIQTDNGAEFGLSRGYITKTIAKTNEFIQVIESYGARHKNIPPGAKTWQSDVETVHRIIEDELYATTIFESKSNYFHKVKTYLQSFNFIRINYHKEAQTPWQILKKSLTHLNESFCFYDFLIILILDDLPLHQHKV